MTDGVPLLSSPCLEIICRTGSDAPSSLSFYRKEGGAPAIVPENHSVTGNVLLNAK